MDLLDISKALLEIFGAESFAALPGKIMKALLDPGEGAAAVGECRRRLGAERDFVGEAYQYHCADREGMKQDLTPAALADLCARLAGAEGAETAYDCCAGAGAMSLAALRLNKSIRLVCDELDEGAIPFLLLNLALGGASALARRADALTGEVFEAWRVERGGSVARVSAGDARAWGGKADVALSNPPFNVRWDPDPEFRFPCLPGCQLPPQANWAFALKCLSVADRAAVIQAMSLITPRPGAEAAIAEALLERGWIKCVAAMPDSMFEKTSIGVCAAVFSKLRGPGDPVAFIDHRGEFLVDGRLRRGQSGGPSHEGRTYKKSFKTLSPGMIERAAALAEGGKDALGLAKSASLGEIRRAGLSLLPSAYVRHVPEESERRSFKDIVGDLNRIRRRRNELKLTLSQTAARKLGLAALAGEAAGSAWPGEELAPRLEALKSQLGCESLVKDDFLSLTRDKIFKIEDKSGGVSDLMAHFLQCWAQRTIFLNSEESLCLAELRDALLPGLMSGEISVSAESGGS
jgi:type I restriction-modification system DNA methylase subunit